MTPFQRFISKQLALAAGLGGITWYVFSEWAPNNKTLAWPFLLLFFIAVNSLLFWMNQRAQQKKLTTYANYFMLASFLKLVVYLVVIVVYLLYFRRETIPFLITFFVYYVAFTVLEVGSVAIMKSKQTNQ